MRIATAVVVTFVAGVVVTLTGVGLASHETFSDVPDDHPHAAGVHWLAPAVEGFPDGTFRPNHPVTRGQVATMMQRSARPYILVTPECGTLNFSARDLQGRGSGAASVSYSMNGGEPQPVDEIPAVGEGSLEFTVDEPGVMMLLVDSGAVATAHTLQDCTP